MQAALLHDAEAGEVAVQVLSHPVRSDTFVISIIAASLAGLLLFGCIARSSSIASSRLDDVLLVPAAESTDGLTPSHTLVLENPRRNEITDRELSAWALQHASVDNTTLSTGGHLIVPFRKIAQDFGHRTSGIRPAMTPKTPSRSVLRLKNYYETADVQAAAFSGAGVAAVHAAAEQGGDNEPSEWPECKTFPKKKVQAIVRPPEGQTHKATVFFLHGLGGSGTDWAHIARKVPLPYVKWVFPTAPALPVTLTKTVMNGWYDINSLDVGAIEDDRIRTLQSAAYLQQLIDEEIKAGIPSEKIVIGGFSQGGAIALTTALRTDKPLAGLFTLSSYMPLALDYPTAMGPYAKDLDVFLAHGTADNIVAFEHGTNIVEKLKELGIRDEFKVYEGMAHKVSQEQFKDLEQYFTKVLKLS
eukprot:gnl/TRDRNA2_/TRDRNA2_93293_c0_seq1.p1 gnl/TRDRNA2_/TRDRNA2_93293_c0~~gnl/TRDRNA2_/TRDRNA2_93293_c0_seq1.p1  ORF type:complete len:415 (+),score=70.27 gnl/TRDRNA2_/TRDRNA2_93293_c0_seq1:78-1322(+)